MYKICLIRSNFRHTAIWYYPKPKCHLVSQDLKCCERSFRPLKITRVRARFECVRRKKCRFVGGGDGCIRVGRRWCTFVRSQDQHMAHGRNRTSPGLSRAPLLSRQASHAAHHCKRYFSQIEYSRPTYTFVNRLFSYNRDRIIMGLEKEGNERTFGRRYRRHTDKRTGHSSRAYCSNTHF